MNLIFIKTAGDFIKIINGYLVIIFLAFLPILISITGGFIGDLFGYNWNESNSVIGVIGWLSILTIPIGIFVAILWTILSIYNIINFLKRK